MRLFLFALCLSAGMCVAAEPLTEQRVVTVAQESANFKVVQRNVTANSFGAFVLLAGAGASKSLAMDRLVKKAELTEGSSRTLINLVIDKRVVFFLVGTATIITARADVIEYIDQ